MKTRGSAVRFVAVSATVPNIDDVSDWIASRDSSGAAATFRVTCRHVVSRVLTFQQFGEEYRPCQLSRFVYGFPRAKNQNDFLFARSLNYRLFPLLQQHSANKPILIFVSTRKGLRCRESLSMASNEKIRSPYHSRTINGGLLQSRKQ